MLDLTTSSVKVCDQWQNHKNKVERVHQPKKVEGGALA